MEEQGNSTVPDRAVAVLGMSGRFPGAGGVRELWGLLTSGRDGITDAPPERAWLRELYAAEPGAPGRLPTVRGGFLPGLDLFDAGFFGISPREARRMDPQQRLLLETSVEAAEDASVPVRELSRARTGVFLGAFGNDYWLRQIGDLDELDLFALQGGTHSALHGRIAYALNLRGPAMTIDTACSSSLVSVHAACQSLRLGECDYALAGGCHVLLAPYASVSLARAGALGPEGRCKFGDASADGYVQSEAVGMLLLKPLARALADGDRVRAVILGGAVGSGGFTGQGMIAPTVRGQEEVLRLAYESAGVDPRDTRFVEAHGPGTAAGDPVELKALARVLGPRDGDRERCVVGSVKTSIGHTEAAAGVAGIIRTVLCLEHRLVPGDARLRTPTPAVDWDTAPLSLARRPTALPDDGRPLVAGVTSFGASGVGAHLVLSAAPADRSPAPQERPGTGPLLLPLSARSATALRELAERYANLLESPSAPSPAAVCASAATGRDHHEHRLAASADTPGALAGALRAHLAGQERRGVSASDGAVWSAPRVVFVFPGQGSQWAGMGRGLLGREPVFTDTLQRCDAVIREHGGWSLCELLESGDDSRLRRTATIQPALWAMGVSLAALWRSWGIEPDAVMGHSQGEITAAQVAGALTLEEAGRVSCLRAALIDELAGPGALCWVEVPPGQAATLVEELGVVAGIAVEESPTSTVLAGTPEAVDRIEEGCERRGVSCIRVPVAYAAHSPSVDPVRRPLTQRLAGLHPRGTRVPFISTVTGAELPGTALDGDYWWRNLREPVLLDTAVRTQLTGERRTVFLQVSPHPVLATALSREGALALESLRRDHDEPAALRRSLGALYAAGCDPDWPEVLGRPTTHVPLPGYPWQRFSYWQQARAFPWPPVRSTSPEAIPVSGTPVPRPSESPHPVLTPAAEDGTGTPSWEGALDRDRHAYLLGHRVAERPVVPGTFYLELALAAAAETGLGSEVRDVTFDELLLLDDDEPWNLRVGVRASAEDARRLSLTSRRSGNATRQHHATLRLTGDTTQPPPPVALDDVRGRCAGWQAGEHFYRDRAAGGNDWRGPFRCVAEIHHGTEEALVRLRPVARDGHRIHPGTLDGCLQAALAVAGPVGPAGRGFVLTAVDRLSLYRRPDEEELWVHASLREPGPEDGIRVDLVVADRHGTVVAEITGVRGRSLTPAPVPRPASRRTDRTLRVRWRQLPPPARSGRGGNWLLLSGGSPLDRALDAVLTENGGTVHTVRPGSGFRAHGPGRYQADPTSADDLALVLKEVTREAPLTGVVHLGALAGATGPDASPREVQWVTTDLCAGLLPVSHALAGLPSSPPTLFVITRGAQAALDDDEVPAPWQAALWPLVRVLRLETARCPSVLVDLDARGPASREPRDEAGQLAAHLYTAGSEDRIALRGGTAHVPRLVPSPPDPAPQSPGAVLTTTGGIGGISLTPAKGNPPPGPGRIAIEVTHTSLNYHDVLRALGMLAGEEETLLGCECAGTVVAVGEGVTDFAVGDQVCAFTFSPPASYTVTPAACAVSRPHRLTPAEAASFPVAYVSAYRGLIDMARLQPGQKVLVHSASGGMGMAAMEVARWRGARVYATAGTEAKRDLLLRMGAEKVADSRSPDFAHRLLDPDGTGVDVVLNTLKGAEARQANFELLAPFGHYVETACNELHDGQSLPARLFAPGRSYHAMNLAALHAHDPVNLGTTLREVASLLSRGELRPPRVRVFEAQRAAEAMRLMAQAEHIGKLALHFPPSGRPRTPLRPDATYLVVGGLSGIGGLFTEWLADHGARHLLVTGRTDLSTTAPADPRARLLARLGNRPDLQVQYAAVDVADEPAMSALLRERAHRGLPGVAGVVHSALALDPAPLRDTSEEEIDRTLRPKVAGGWTLHRLFPGDGLDFFVLFSSAVSPLSGLRLSSQLGSYAAANAFLDALGAHRRAAGAPATVVNWGYWAGTGMAHRLGERDGRSVLPAGILPIEPAQAPELFTAVLAADGDLCCVPADWHAYVASAPQDATDPILQELLDGAATPPSSGRTGRTPLGTGSPTPPTTRSSGSTDTVTVVDMVAATAETATDTEPARTADRWHPAPSTSALPRVPHPSLPGNGPAQRGEDAPPPPPRHSAAPSPTASDLEHWLAAQVARVLDMPVDEVDPTQPLNRLGIDSLLAAELTTRLRREHHREITVPRLLKATGLRALAAELASGTQGGAT
ncbi:beta-ketoacyl synthase N-terminal-like domain-containing protein [Streptomyces ziwulingensis]